MKRIRYVKSENGLESMQTISGPSGVYRTRISADGKKGFVVANDGNVIKEVTGTSAHKTKIAVKNSLEALGVVFDKESRKPRIEKEN